MVRADVWRPNCGSASTPAATRVRVRAGQPARSRRRRSTRAAHRSPERGSCGRRATRMPRKKLRRCAPSLDGRAPCNRVSRPFAVSATEAAPARDRAWRTSAGVGSARAARGPTHLSPALSDPGPPETATCSLRCCTSPGSARSRRLLRHRPTRRPDPERDRRGAGTSLGQQADRVGVYRGSGRDAPRLGGPGRALDRWHPGPGAVRGSAACAPTSPASAVKSRGSRRLPPGSGSVGPEPRPAGPSPAGLRRPKSTSRHQVSGSPT